MTQYRRDWKTQGIEFQHRRGSEYGQKLFRVPGHWSCQQCVYSIDGVIGEI